MDLDKEIQRGHRAKQILDDDLVKDARNHIEAELWRLFKETSPQETKTLEFLKAMQYYHSKYFAYFEKAITDGKIAQINLESKKKTIRERIFG